MKNTSTKHKIKLGKTTGTKQQSKRGGVRETQERLRNLEAAVLFLADCIERGEHLDIVKYTHAILSTPIIKKARANARIKRK